MNTTPNYEFNVCVGDDLVNPLVQNFPNWSNLDTILRNVENKGIGTATELKTGTVHALTRDDTNIPFIRFQATSRFDSNDSFTVDGLSVSALDVSGQALGDGAFVIGAMVLCELRDTVLTVYVGGSADAQTLDGHPASYFATKTEVDAVDDKADANHTLIENLQLQVNDLSGEIENIKIDSDYSTDEQVIGTWIDGKPIYQKTVDLINPVTISSTSWVPISAFPVTNIDLVIKAVGLQKSGNDAALFWLNCGKGTSYLQFIVARDNSNAGARFITVQYTKITD